MEAEFINNICCIMRCKYAYPVILMVTVGCAGSNWQLFWQYVCDVLAICMWCSLINQLQISLYAMRQCMVSYVVNCADFMPIHRVLQPEYQLDSIFYKVWNSLRPNVQINPALINTLQISSIITKVLDMQLL